MLTFYQNFQKLHTQMKGVLYKNGPLTRLYSSLADTAFAQNISETSL